MSAAGTCPIRTLRLTGMGRLVVRRMADGRSSPRLLPSSALLPGRPQRASALLSDHSQTPWGRREWAFQIGSSESSLSYAARACRALPYRHATGGTARRMAIRHARDGRLAGFTLEQTGLQELEPDVFLVFPTST